MAPSRACGYLCRMKRDELFFNVALVVTGLALVGAGLWMLADRPVLTRAVLVASGAVSLLRAAYLFWKRRNAKGS
jgi:hypothetical protein